MIAIVLGVAVFIFVFRLHLVRRCWPLPLKHGSNFFLAQPVRADFYEGAGQALLKRYHASLFVPLAVDAPVVVWLLLAQKYTFLSLEQTVAYVISLVGYNVMVVHFGIRAADLSANESDCGVKAVQLSMAPRRLRDYTRTGVELVIAGSMLLDAMLLWHAYRLSHSAGATHAEAGLFRGGIIFAIWITYWQLGALLLKSVFVRWRMPLPVNRTEEFRRWRAAWLSCNLNTLDAVRLLIAAVLPWTTAWIIYRQSWPMAAMITVVSGSLLIFAVYMVYVRRVHRRLKAAEKELKPVEMVKEFPRRPVAEGRFLAGGLLYFNRENPYLLVRSPQGVAINLSHPGTYAWTAYFAGLLALITWMTR